MKHGHEKTRKENSSSRGRDPGGGSASLVFNQELRLPVWNLFRGVGFVDAGNVFSSVRDLSFRALKVAVGLGLRAETPVGLFRLDYGIPLSRREDDPGRVNDFETT